mgnify:FL=1|jgi:hypothetical protein
MADIKDKLVLAVNEFKKSLDGNTISIHGKSYAQVSLRIAVARRVLGSAMDIISKIQHMDKESVVMQADIFIDDKHVATGHAEEKRTSSKINMTSALENCETSAIGRALAFLGFISDGIASAEEVSTAIVQQDKKIQLALKDLEAVSHKGSYQEWLSKNKPMLSELKLKNPIAYATFMEDFQSYKTNLQTKGVI